MRPRTARSLEVVTACVVGSILVHLGLATSILWIMSDSWIPKMEVVWLDLDNALGVSRTPPDTPKQPVAASKTQEPSRAPQTADQQRAKRSKRGDRAAQTKARRRARAKSAHRGRDQPELARMAPGEAALIMVLRLDRIRRSPYAAAVRRLLAVFYDYKTLLSSGDIDPVRDFDALMIATPNPYRVTRTFLAARHRHDDHEHFKTAIDAAVSRVGGQMRWSPHEDGLLGDVPSPPKLRGDPRVVILGDGLLLLVDPKLQDELLRSRNPDRGHPRNEAHGDHALPMIELLRGLDRQGGPRNAAGPGLLLQAVNVQRLVRLPPDLPTPATIQVTIPATDPARLRGTLSFAHRKAAETFLRVARQRLGRAQQSVLLRMLGIGTLLDRIVLRRQRATVKVRLRLTALEAKQALATFGELIPQVPVPGRPRPATAPGR